MTQPQLTALCRRWRKRLQLSGWKRVRVRFCRREKMGDDELGRIEFWPEMLRAHISILHPEDRSGKDEDTIELDLIHELLHLVIDGHRIDRKYDVGHERAINAITEALWRAYKPKRRRKSV